MKHFAYVTYFDARSRFYRVAPTSYLLRKYRELNDMETFLQRLRMDVHPDVYDRVADHACSVFWVLHRRGVLHMAHHPAPSKFV